MLDSAANRAEKTRGLDEEAFAALYAHTASGLFAYLLRVCGNRDDADDILQECYCRYLVAARPAMDEGQTKSYLYRIAANLLRDRWRRVQSHARVLPGVVPKAADGPDTNILAHLQQLSQREQVLLWLAYVERATHKEIAAATGLQPGSIRILLFRARRKLAKALRSAPNESE